MVVFCQIIRKLSVAIKPQALLIVFLWYYPPK